jgi:rhodanese-related sulfurtransferase
MTFEISPQQFATAHAEGAYVVDVREPDEYRSGHVPGAALIPLSLVPMRIDEIPQEETVYVICHSGGRSAQAVQYLRRFGVDAINVAGGTDGWIQTGQPVVTGDHPGERAKGNR